MPAEQSLTFVMGFVLVTLRIQEAWSLICGNDELTILEGSKYSVQRGEWPGDVNSGLGATDLLIGNFIHQRKEKIDQLAVLPSSNFLGLRVADGWC
ncbi:hypothetical protein K474DRAFT_1666797 [Panus rudis PR-1116 ss-1]|nr:hypothetical protein K474DRAFT_1666797 [Panus rudis PR-1116 ss-1]